ncbi:MAG: TolC family protein [Vicinamibacteria bacterium]|nr:TolC family protein [Vicinamibacteria bacterium]
MTAFQRITGVMVAATLLPVPARGQEAARTPALAAPYIDERAGMGLDAAIARALQREPSLRAVRADIDVAQGQRLQAGLLPSPMLNVERRDEPAGTDNQTSIGVEWPLDLFRRRGRVQVAERALDATRLAVADRERLLAAEVRRQYGAAAAAVRDVAVADEQADTVQRQLDVLRGRVDEGVTPPLERDLMDVELRRLDAERALAAGRADVAMVQLKQLLGMGPDEPLVLRQTLESLVTSSAPGAETDRAAKAIAERADVREAVARVALAGARVDQARREGRIDVTLFGSYMRMDAGFPQQGFNTAGGLERVRGRFDYIAAGATFTLPVFNRNQGQVGAAQAEQTGAEARRDAAELAAHAELAGARARDGRARQAVAVYIGGLRALARKNLDVVRQTFELGRATVSDVLAEQRRVLDIEQAYTFALREAWEARAALKRALGETR